MADLPHGLIISPKLPQTSVQIFLFEMWYFHHSFVIQYSNCALTQSDGNPAMHKHLNTGINYMCILLNDQTLNVN